MPTVDDNIVIRVPRRDWAEVAISDLATEGCRAELLDGPDPDGQWSLMITGPAETIAIMRYELNADSNRVCWETFVNGLALA